MSSVRYSHYITGNDGKKMQESDGFKDENIKEDVNVTLHSGNHVPI